MKNSLKTEMKVSNDSPAKLCQDASIYLAITEDGGVLFDLSRDALFKLTPVAAYIWFLLAKGVSEFDTASTIASHYQIDLDRASNDLRALLQEAARMGLTPADVTFVEKETFENIRTVNSGEYKQLEIIQPTATSLHMIATAFLYLALFDLVLSLCSMQRLCRAIETWRVRTRHKDQSQIIGEVCKSVQKACVWFPHKAVCLQRSAVTTCLLRKYGVEAHLVIGVRPMPFLAHAWTEVDGVVVNDRPQVNAFYQRLATY